MQVSWETSGTAKCVRAYRIALALGSSAVGHSKHNGDQWLADCTPGALLVLGSGLVGEMDP